MTQSSRSVRKAVRYSDDFKEKAIQAMSSGEKTLVILAKEMGVSVPTLINWKKAKRAEISRDSSFPPGTAANEERLNNEIRQLRSELERALEERDRLRRSMATLIGLA